MWDEKPEHVYRELASPRFVHRTLLGIAEGMAFLHHKHTRLHVIHRDLKSENVLMSGPGGIRGYTAKLTDFGLARPFNRETRSARGSAARATTCMRDHMRAPRAPTRSQPWRVATVLCAQ